MSLCSALVFLWTLAVASARDLATVYMIRHGEKPADKNDQGLTPDGWRRAECLRDVFGADSGYNIQHIIAPPVMQSELMHPRAKQGNFGRNNSRAYTDHMNTIDGEHRRPYMTVLPLAHDLGLQIDDHCTRKDSECVADAIRSYDGPGNILISWRHSNMDEIQELLGSESPVDYPINR